MRAGRTFDNHNPIAYDGSSTVIRRRPQGVRQDSLDSLTNLSIGPVEESQHITARYHPDESALAVHYWQGANVVAEHPPGNQW
jgi:hypothetical protein